MYFPTPPSSPSQRVSEGPGSFKQESPHGEMESGLSPCSWASLLIHRPCSGSHLQKLLPGWERVEILAAPSHMRCSVLPWMGREELQVVNQLSEPPWYWEDAHLEMGGLVPPQGSAFLAVWSRSTVSWPGLEVGKPVLHVLLNLWVLYPKSWL